MTTVAPRFPHFDDEGGGDIVRIPSLPLPTATAYRLCVPYVRTVDRSRVRDLAIVHTHSPFVTGWMGANHARRRGIPLVFTYHTRIEAYAHYVPFERRTMQAAAVTLTRSYANAADVVIVPTLAMEARLARTGGPLDDRGGAEFDRRRTVCRRPPLARDPRAAWRAASTTPLALVVSRLAREKNLELAIEALACSRAGPYAPRDRGRWTAPCGARGASARSRGSRTGAVRRRTALGRAARRLRLGRRLRISEHDRDPGPGPGRGDGRRAARRCDRHTRLA